MIPLGRYSLPVIEVRDGEPDRPSVLVVEDMAEWASRAAVSTPRFTQRLSSH